MDREEEHIVQKLYKTLLNADKMKHSYTQKTKDHVHIIQTLNLINLKNHIKHLRKQAIPRVYKR